MIFKINKSMNDSTSSIKDLKNGNSFCQICSLQFKSKTVTAHINGRKHRTTMLQMKQLKQEKTPENRAQLKRKHSPESGNLECGEEKQMTKKGTDSNFANPHNNEDFEKRIATPWRTDFQKLDGSKSTDVNVIEGLPKGFFDYNRMDNNRVRETIEKQQQISGELERFYKEVEDLDTQKEDELEEVAEMSAIRTDIEMIDEQIERWKAVNHLEKKKEDLLESLEPKFEENPSFDPSDDFSNEDVNVDYAKINWRTKTF